MSDGGGMVGDAGRGRQGKTRRRLVDSGNGLHSHSKSETKLLEGFDQSSDVVFKFS